MRPLTLIALLLSLLAGIGAFATRNLSSAPSPEDSLDAKVVRSTLLKSGADSLSFKSHRDGYLIISNLSGFHETAAITVSRCPDQLENVIRWDRLKPLSASPVKIASAPSSREIRSVPPRPNTDPLRERTFFIHVSSLNLNDPRGYELITAEHLREGDRARVYLDRNCKKSEKQITTAQKIIDILDNIVIPSATNLSGSFADVDQDGKLAVLLTPTLERMQGGQTSLKGFVRASDFCKHYPRPYSNRADLIYLNSECSVDTNYLTLLAHEYWHVMQFSQRLAIPSAQQELQEDWICEGTAHLAEQRFGGDGSNLKHRISAWMESPESSPLIVPDYHSVGLWRHEGCRGGLYLFFRWCENRYGPALMTDLLKAEGTGYESLEQVTGERFEILHQHALVGILEESLSSSSLQETDRLLDEDLFKEVSLRQLKVHEATQSAPCKMNLKATASTFLKVTAGQSFRIQTEKNVPLRLLLVPKESLTKGQLAIRPVTSTTR